MTDKERIAEAMYAYLEEVLRYGALNDRTMNLYAGSMPLADCLEKWKPARRIDRRADHIRLHAPLS